MLPLGPVADEADNVRSALGYFLEQEDAEAGLGLAARIHHFWFLRGPREEGRGWLRQPLALASPSSAPSRDTALIAAGLLAELQGDLAEAEVAYAEASNLAASRGDLRGQGIARTQLGVVASLRGRSRGRGRGWKPAPG